MVGAGARHGPHHPVGDGDLYVDTKLQWVFPFLPSRDDAPLPEAEGFTGFDWGNPLELLNIRLDPGGVLVLFHGDRRFVLGRCPCAVADHSYIAEIYPAPGDTTLITLGRGFASWPQAVFRRSKILGTRLLSGAKVARGGGRCGFPAGRKTARPH